MRDERGFDSHTLQIPNNMTTTTYNKVVEIADSLLGQRDMDKYPFFLIIGLLFIAFSLRKYRNKYNIPVFE